MFAIYVRSIPPKEIALPNSTMPLDPIVPIAKEEITPASKDDADDVLANAKSFRVADDGETMEL